MEVEGAAKACEFLDTPLKPSRAHRPLDVARRSQPFITTPASVPWRQRTAEFDLLLFLVGGAIAVIAVLAVVFLRKPLLGFSPSPRGDVLRDLAYRLRATGVPVKETGGRLEVPVGSLGLLKLHAKEAPGGTEVRYEVGASSSGWTVILLLVMFGYVGVVGVAVALWIHVAVSSFARERVAPLLAYGPLGVPPPPTVRTLLIEGLSEAHRLASEAAEYEKEASHNRIGLILLGSLGLFALIFTVVTTYLSALVPNPPLTGFLLGIGSSAASGIAGSLIVYVRAAPRLEALEREGGLFGAAYQAEMLGYPIPGAPLPGLELLLRAAERSAEWREVLRHRKFWHHPVAGMTVFLLVYATVLFLSIGALVDFLPIAMRAGLVDAGVVCGVGTAITVLRWRRDILREDEEERRSWETRRSAIESALWSILSG